MSSTIIDFDMRIAELEQLARHDADPETQTQLLNLRRKRNALTPFGSLPNETIGVILAELILDSSSSPPSFFDLEDMCINHGWTAAMLVCSRFWLVALATSELWSYIDCRRNPSWVALCLQRAGDVPVTLTRVRQHSRSWMRAKIELPAGFSTHVDQEGALGKEKPSPPGVDLIKHPDTKIQQFDWDTDFTETLSHCFLFEKCQHLTQLSLARIVIDASPAFPVLTHLRVDFLSMRDGDYGHMLKMIGNAPLLQVLTIFPTDGSQDDRSYPGAKIRLPHLRVLEIKENLASACMLQQALPDPAELLSLTTSHRSHSAMSIPMTTETSELVTPERLFKWAETFWAKKSGGAKLLPYQLSMEDAPARILFGIPPIDTKSPSPGVHLNLQCDILAGDPMLEHVHTLSLSLNVEDLGETVSEIELPWLRAISPGGYLPNIQHIIVTDIKKTTTAPGYMESWLLRRHEEGRTVESLTFQWRTEDAEAWAHEIESKKIVKHIYWGDE
jgi:hypothetical protein